MTTAPAGCLPVQLSFQRLHCSQAESSAICRAKVKDAGGKDAWALQQAQCAEAAAGLLNQ
jgi:hypothetical protein